MTNPTFFCPECGPLRDSSKGLSPVDEDGCCLNCGATTCSWPDLVEHLLDEGYELILEPDTALLIGEMRS